MGHGSGRGNRQRRRAAGVIGLAIAAVVLAACSSTPGTAISTNSGGGDTAARVAAKPVSLAITPAGSGQINPTTPVVVKATGGTLTTVTVTNTARGTVVTGTMSADKTTWTSSEPLGYGSTYAVNVVGANSGGKSTTQTATISTIQPAKVAYANFFPAPPNVAGVGVGVGQPVTIMFTQPVAAARRSAVQAALTVTTAPSQPGAWYWISSTQVDYRAQTYWQAGTTINLAAKVYGLDLGNGVYGAEDHISSYHVHDAWIAKADGNTEKMDIYDNGNLVNTLPISMGKQSTPTHNGPHVITSKDQQVQMNSCSYGVCPPDPRAYNETEYWAERISNSGEFVHENPATVGVQGSSNVSHGCINLSAAAAQWFFDHLGVGDVVEVTNSGGPQLPIYDLYGDWAVPWSTWQAGNA